MKKNIAEYNWMLFVLFVIVALILAKRANVPPDIFLSMVILLLIPIRLKMQVRLEVYLLLFVLLFFVFVLKI